jgi:hypothetical protein
MPGSLLRGCHEGPESRLAEMDRGRKNRRPVAPVAELAYALAREHQVKAKFSGLVEDAFDVPREVPQLLVSMRGNTVGSGMYSLAV